MLGRLFKGLLPNPLKKSKHEQAGADPLAEARRHIDEKRFDLAREIVDARLAEDAEDAQAWCLRGELRYWEKDDASAIECFDKALRLRPELHRAHYGLSLTHFELGQVDKAQTHAQYALGRNRNSAAYAAQAGLCELALGNNHFAIKALKRAIQLDSRNPKVWNNLGIAHRSLGYFEKARSYFLRAVELDPGLEIAHRNLAQLFSESGDTIRATTHERAAEAIAAQEQGAAPSSTDDVPGEALPETLLRGTKDSSEEAIIQEIDRLVAADQPQQAVALAERALADHPDATAVAVKLCDLLENRGDFQDALDVIEVALVHKPEDPQLLAAKGGIYEKFCLFPKAAELLERANELDPDNLGVLLHLADVYFELEDYARAEGIVSRVHALANTPITRLQLATAQLNACLYEEALESFQSVIREHPQIYEPQIARNLGLCLQYLGRTEEALRELNAAVVAEPDNSSSRMARALVNLLLERYEEGWEDYRHRLFVDIHWIRLLPFPVWEGQPLAGKRLLIVAEQGLGDQIMFASCFPDLLRLKPANVFIETHKRLEKTIARSFPQCRVIGTNQGHKFEWLKEIGEPDYYVHAGDLAGCFRPSRAAFPRHQGYLVADPQRIAFWRERLDALGGGPKIGVSWRGGTQRTRKAVRSLRIEDLDSILRHPGARFVSLQYGEVADEVREAEATLGTALPHWPEAIADLDEFAALISALDLVISVCNTTVHFAGALGKPVWVMAPSTPEWRYGLNTRSMSWYPSSTMFRQAHLGNWGDLVQDVASALFSRFPPAPA